MFLMLSIEPKRMSNRPFLDYNGCRKQNYHLDNALIKPKSKENYFKFQTNYYITFYIGYYWRIVYVFK